jgi:hypothetical protein
MRVCVGETSLGIAMLLGGRIASTGVASPARFAIFRLMGSEVTVVLPKALASQSAPSEGGACKLICVSSYTIVTQLFRIKLTKGERACSIGDARTLHTRFKKGGLAYRTGDARTLLRRKTHSTTSAFDSTCDCAFLS